MKIIKFSVEDLENQSLIKPLPRNSYHSLRFTKLLFLDKYINYYKNLESVVPRYICAGGLNNMGWVVHELTFIFIPGFCFIG